MDEDEKKVFVRLLGKMLRENYDITDEFLRKELDSQLAGDKPNGFMGVVIEQNLKKGGWMK